MADAALPPSGNADVGSAARLGLALLAGIIAKGGANYLVSHGIITDADTAEVISIGTSIIMAGAAVVWAKFKNLHIGEKLNAAAATGDPTADPSAPSVKAAVSAAAANPSSAVAAKVSS